MSNPRKTDLHYVAGTFRRVTWVWKGSGSIGPRGVYSVIQSYMGIHQDRWGYIVLRICLGGWSSVGVPQIRTMVHRAERGSHSEPLKVLGLSCFGHSADILVV